MGTGRRRGGGQESLKILLVRLWFDFKIDFLSGLKFGKV